MEKYDALDWQSFSQKKDIEEIAKNTRERRNIEIAATIEIAMAVLSIVSDNLFREQIPIWISVPIVVVSVLALGWLAYIYLRKWYENKKVGNDIPDVSLMLNLFDNDICYYALMAESYTDKIGKIQKSNPTDVEQFYFIEACFYINKTIYNLSMTSGCADKLYSVNVDDLFISKKISYTRLKNIFNIIDSCIAIIDKKTDIISGIDKDDNYLKLCNKYRKSYNTFKKLFRKYESSM